MIISVLVRSYVAAMGSSEHSRAAGARDVGTTVFTDGACSGNPGPGGWAWIEPDGPWAAGFDPDTTNQRMELTAVLRACERFEDPLHIVSDSTYVVNCWRDRWWSGWLKRNWRNSRKDPVANRDLWEQVVPHFRDRPGLRLEWVKGHSGDRWNDLADRLAVGALQRRGDTSGEGDPPEEVLGSADRNGGGRSSSSASSDRSSRPSDAAGPTSGAESRSGLRRSADPRVPLGQLVVVTGARSASPDRTGLLAKLSRVLAAQSEMNPEVVVLSGLRRGAESLGVAAARDAGLPYVVVLPYPDPTADWPEAETAEFRRCLEGAREVVVLENKRPTDLEGRRKSLARRDGWLRSVADSVVFMADPADADSEDSLSRWEKALGEDLWRLDVTAQQ
jgi:ribonuclease HI